jgi:cell fate regulator YaaT (PSP1 superfamily)
MSKIIGVKFLNSPKTYYFSPEGIEFKADDGAIVETMRGVEYARVVIGNKEVPESEIVKPLKPVIRKATVEDQEQYDRNIVDAEKALKTAQEKLNKYKLDLKFVDVEYTFDRKKIIFYFTAPSRVDFRVFVRDLGATFKTRIELRQIHERDDFKMKGALAPCGRECCCSTHLNDFDKVTIKMAKVQGLSLNPQKISGLCGKLMCCLKYENETYKEAAYKMPKEGLKVMTPDGEGKVESNDLIRMRCRVKIQKEDGVLRNYYDVKDLDFTPVKEIPERDEEDEADEILFEEGGLNHSETPLSPAPKSVNKFDKKKKYNKKPKKHPQK